MRVNFQKIIDDTLKTPKTGKWSRKSLTMLSSFVMAVILGIYITISDYFLGHEINRYAIDVFFGFLALAGGTSVLTVWDKIRNKNNHNHGGHGGEETEGGNNIPGDDINPEDYPEA